MSGSESIISGLEVLQFGLESLQLRLLALAVGSLRSSILLPPLLNSIQSQSLVLLEWTEQLTYDGCDKTNIVLFV